jgi:hypothetical protein
MLEKFPGDIASWCWLYFVAKSSHVGADVDGVACPLHRPTAWDHPTGDEASCQVLPCPVELRWAVTPF